MPFPESGSVANCHGKSFLWSVFPKLTTLGDHIRNYYSASWNADVIESDLNEFLRSTLIQVTSTERISVYVPHNASIIQVIPAVRAALLRSRHASLSQQILCHGACAGGRDQPTVNAPNSAVIHFVSSKMWAKVLDIIGVQNFAQMLANCRIFVSATQKTDCQVYVQISGIPLDNEIRQKRLAENENRKNSKKLSSMKIERSRIFYRSSRSIKLEFPKTARLLVSEIFRLPRSRSKSSRIAKRYRSVLPIVKTFLKRHATCPYWKLLRVFCPVDLEIQPLQDDAGASKTLLGQTSTNEQVVRFLNAVLRRNLSPQALGCKHNWNVFMGHLRTFIQMRRHETLRVPDLLQGMKLSSVPWLPVLHSADHDVRRRVFAHWLRWLYERTVIPLIQRAFYVTESEPFKYRVLYYRHSVWKIIQENAVEAMCQTNFKKLSEEKAMTTLSRKVTDQKVSFGYGKLRFLPKGNGTTRPILNLSSPSPLSHFRSLRSSQTLQP
eukprot:900307_1